MTRHSDETRLRNMCDHAREALDLARGRVRADLDSDRTLNLALVRLLEIVGEAAARVSDDTRNQHRDIPWTAMAGLRNRLIHGYDEVDFDILWQVIESDLPVLVERLESLLRDASS